MTTSKKKSSATGSPGLTGAMMSVNPEAMQTWQEIMTEWGRFVTDRLHQDIETQRALLECKTPTDLMRVQTEFYQNAVKQYSEETMRLMQMFSEAAGKSMAEVGSARKYDDVPL